MVWWKFKEKYPQVGMQHFLCADFHVVLSKSAENCIFQNSQLYSKEVYWGHFYFMWIAYFFLFLSMAKGIDAIVLCVRVCACVYVYMWCFACKQDMSREIPLSSRIFGKWMPHTKWMHPFCFLWRSKVIWGHQRSNLYT